MPHMIKNFSILILAFISLRTAYPNQEQVRLLWDSCNNYIYTDFERAIDFADSSFNLSKRMGDQDLVVRSAIL